MIARPALRIRILQILNKQGPLTYTQITDEIPDASTYDVARELQVFRCSAIPYALETDGVWSITPDGQAQAWQF